MVGLTKVLSILFIFTKNQLLVLIIFYIVFLISSLFTSALIFIIDSLLLTLGLICSPFYSSFRYNIRFFIWHVSIFLMFTFIALNYSIRTTFSASPKFCMFCFHFILPQDAYFPFNFFFDSLVSQESVV